MKKFNYEVHHICGHVENYHVPIYEAQIKSWELCPKCQHKEALKAEKYLGLCDPYNGNSKERNKARLIRREFLADPTIRLLAEQYKNGDKFVENEAIGYSLNDNLNYEAYIAVKLIHNNNAQFWINLK